MTETMTIMRPAWADAVNKSQAVLELINEQPTITFAEAEELVRKFLNSKLTGSMFYGAKRGLGLTKRRRQKQTATVNVPGIFSKRESGNTTESSKVDLYLKIEAAIEKVLDGIKSLDDDRLYESLLTARRLASRGVVLAKS